MSVEPRAPLDEETRERFINRFLAEFDHWEAPWSPEDAERVWAIFTGLAEEVDAPASARVKPAAEEPRIILSPEERAQRLLDGREGWNAHLHHTGGGIVVCSVEREPEDPSAPYAWISSSEVEGKPYEVGIYLRERSEEALSMRELAEGELESYVFAELTRLAGST